MKKIVQITKFKTLPGLDFGFKAVLVSTLFGFTYKKEVIAKGHDLNDLVGKISHLSMISQKLSGKQFIGFEFPYLVRGIEFAFYPAAELTSYLTNEEVHAFYEAITNGKAFVDFAEKKFGKL